MSGVALSSPERLASHAFRSDWHPAFVACADPCCCRRVDRHRLALPRGDRRSWSILHGGDLLSGHCGRILRRSSPRERAHDRHRAGAPIRAGSAHFAGPIRLPSVRGDWPGGRQVPRLRERGSRVCLWPVGQAGRDGQRIPHGERGDLRLSRAADDHLCRLLFHGLVSRGACCKRWFGCSPR